MRRYYTVFRAALGFQVKPRVGSAEKLSVVAISQSFVPFKPYCGAHDVTGKIG